MADAILHEPRLFATDVDGTLFNSAHKLTPAAEAAIVAAREAVEGGRGGQLEEHVEAARVEAERAPPQRRRRRQDRHVVEEQPRQGVVELAVMHEMCGQPEAGEVGGVEALLNTNFFGPKRVSEAFVDLLDPAAYDSKYPLD